MLSVSAVYDMETGSNQYSKICNITGQEQKSQLCLSQYAFPILHNNQDFAKSNQETNQLAYNCHSNLTNPTMVYSTAS